MVAIVTRRGARSALGSVKDLIESKLPAAAAGFRTWRAESRLLQRDSRKTSLGFQLVGDPSMQDGTFEPEETALLQRLLRDADLFVDVGANVGFYSCLARSMGVATIAVEPITANLRVLFRNLQENGWNDTEVWPVGLSDTTGIADIYGGGTAASLVAGWAGNREANRQTIPLTTLDRLLDGRLDGKRLVIKVDVEGAEFQLLSGATETLQRTPQPTWLMEIVLKQHRPAVNERFMETFELFWSNGYQCFTADAAKTPVSRDDVSAWVARNEELSVYSWLFVPGSHK
jgi:FkbM family methyltransferase